MIHKNGYVILNNVLTEDDVNHGLSCIQNNKVNYSMLKNFIDTRFFPAIQSNLDFAEPNYVKFRLSNNNNSTDASTFHSDIYNYTSSEYLPIYTCLCYFDEAQLEVIPGSHHDKKFSIHKKKVLKVTSGDIIVFHANLHHRGINFNKIGNRRLLQVFEVFPDKPTYHNHFKKLVIVETSRSSMVKNLVNPIMFFLSKFPFVIDCITFFHYFLMYNDLHQKILGMDITPWDKHNKYVTYEPGKRILIEEVNTYEEINVNILCNKHVKSVSYSNFYFYIYLAFFISFLIVIHFRGLKPNKSFRRLR